MGTHNAEPGQEISALLDLIKSARHCVALSGAGISTLSGIPDFRGIYPAGLLRRFSPEVLNLYLDGLEDHKTIKNEQEFILFSDKVFDSARFEEDPAFFYKTAGPLLYRKFRTAEPSVVHEVLAELERGNLLKAIITQNIDMLHRKAGNLRNIRSRVIELHGSPAIHYCLRCPGIRVDYDTAVALFDEGKIPLCPRCGMALKPGITFYGDMLPLEARRKAEEEAQEADVMLVLGTSLTVHPAAALPRTVLRRGGKIVIVNRQDTILDGNAALHFRELEEVFSALRFMLG